MLYTSDYTSRQCVVSPVYKECKVLNRERAKHFETSEASARNSDGIQLSLRSDR